MINKNKNNKSYQHNNIHGEEQGINNNKDNNGFNKNNNNNHKNIIVKSLTLCSFNNFCMTQQLFNMKTTLTS